jgi:hypothetical protein
MEYVAFSNQIFRRLDATGDGSGSKDAAVDGSSVVKEFLIAAPAGQIYELNRMLINIQASGVLASQKYGDLAALTNGIKIYVESNGVRSEFDTGAVKTHDDWAGICHDSMALNYGNVAGKTISVRWTFSKSGHGISLDGDKAEKFIVQINDDLSSLTKHQFMVQGEIDNK